MDNDLTSSWSWRTSERRHSNSVVLGEAEVACTAATADPDASMMRSAISARSSRVMVGSEEAKTMRTLAGSRCRNSSRRRASLVSSLQSCRMRRKSCDGFWSPSSTSPLELLLVGPHCPLDQCFPQCGGVGAVSGGRQNQVSNCSGRVRSKRRNDVIKLGFLDGDTACGELSLYLGEP